MEYHNIVYIDLGRAWNPDDGEMFAFDFVRNIRLGKYLYNNSYC